MSNPTRRLLFYVKDRNNQPVEDVLVRFFVNNKMYAEGPSHLDSPLVFNGDTRIEIVDVEVIYGKIHEWLKVPMDAGEYTYTIDLAAANPARTPPSPTLDPVPPLPPPAPLPPPPASLWKNPVIISALIAAFAAIFVGYLQFVKPHKNMQADTVKFRILVKDTSTQLPISNAQVTVEDGAHHLVEKTDANGSTPIFTIQKDGPGSIRVDVSATSYEPGTRNIDRPTADEAPTIYLTPMHVPPVKNGSEAHLNLAGTWEIETPADPTNARMGNGSFTFTPQADHSISATAHFDADGSKVRLDGTCGMQGREVHIAFTANTDQGGSWKGTGDFHFESATRIKGRLQSKRGDDLPFVLIKP